MTCNIRDGEFFILTSDSGVERETCEKCIEGGCSCSGISDPRKLSLKNQGISTLPKNSINLDNLVSINLEGNNFSEIPTEILSLISLKSLNVAKNDLKTLPNEVGNLANLEFLNCSENYLETLPVSLSMASRLLSLEVSKNKIVSIPDELKSLKRLEKVNLSFNNLTEMPHALIFGSKFISQLDLSSNNLKDLPNEPKCSSSIKILKVNDNTIEDLPVWMRCLPTVEELHLGNNCFKCVPHHPIDDMMPLESITMVKLCINSCGLKNLPSSIRNMKNLIYLDAGNEGNVLQKIENVIWDITPALSLQYLKELKMPGVGLPVLPVNIWDMMKNLETLDLRNNSIMWLPEGFSHRMHLTTLLLSNNRLALLPEEIGSVKTLKELSLDKNKLQELPDALGALENLFYLDLYDNELSEVPFSMCNLHHLKCFDVEMNHFVMDRSLNEVSDKILANYPIMRESLRSCHIASKNRMTGTKLPLPNICDDDSVGGCSKSSSLEHFENEPDLQESFHSCSIAEEEDWDKSDGSDNFFDPEYSQALKDSATRSQWHWARDNGRWEPPVEGDVFCPADIHPDTISRTPNKGGVNVNDGQFDDADDMS